MAFPTSVPTRTEKWQFLPQWYGVQTKKDGNSNSGVWSGHSNFSGMVCTSLLNGSYSVSGMECTLFTEWQL
jgi:hypothetical protein